MSRLVLRTPSQWDHKLLVKWRNQSLSYFYSSSPITLESHLEWYEQIELDDTQQFYAIGLGHTCMGAIGLKDIDLVHKRAEYGRLIIAPSYRGQGYGRHALLSLLDYAFGGLDLNRVYGYILANNFPGLATALSVGFSIEGVLNQHVYKDAVYLDVISVGILADDWRDS